MIAITIKRKNDHIRFGNTSLNIVIKRFTFESVCNMNQFYGHFAYVNVRQNGGLEIPLPSPPLRK